MKLDNIKIIGEFKHLQIREIRNSGGYHRRALTPEMDVSSEDEKIRAIAEAEWTDEVKSAWATFQAEQEAKPTE